MIPVAPRGPAPLDRLVCPSEGDLAELRAAFARVGYDAAAIARVESIAPRQFDRVRVPIVLYHLERRAEPWAVLARAFAYGADVARRELEVALGERLVGVLVDAGVLEADSDRMHARFVLMPFEGLHVLSDDLSAGRDAVMGPGITTSQLAAAMHVSAGMRVLDLGTGAGSLALLASKRGAHAVGTDINERAVAIARFNARLNALDTEFRVGDLYSPVSGETFELLVSQPPFVVSVDRHASTFLHGGRRGDELALRVLAEAPRHLSPAGTALVRVDAPVAPGEPISERVRASIGSAPLDVLAFASPGASLDLQAVGYAQLVDPTLGAPYVEAVRAYRARLEEADFEATSQTLVVLRASSSRGGAYALTLTPPSLARVDAEAIEEVARALAIVTGPPEAMLAARLSVPPGTRLVEERTVDGSEVRVRACFARGVAPDHEVSDTSAVLLTVFGTPSDVAGATECFTEATGLSAAEARERVQRFAREALVRGLLRVC